MTITDTILRWIRLRHRETHFFATVDVYTGGNRTATIIRNGQTIADAQPYQIADSIGSLSNGQSVLVVDYTGEGAFVIVARFTATAD